MNNYTNTVIPGFGTLLMFFIVMMGIFLAFIVFYIVLQWKIFVKAGEKGWWSLVPFANTYHLFKITWGNGNLFWLLLLPVGNLILIYATCYKLAKSFGMSTGLAVACIFISPIIMAIIAFDKKYTYQGPQTEGKKAVVAATAVLGVLYLTFLILISSLIVTSVKHISSLDTQHPGDAVFETDFDADEKMTEASNAQAFETQELTNGTTSVSVPVLPNSATFDDIVCGYTDGITLQTEFKAEQTTDAASALTEEVQTMTDTYQTLGYENISLEDLFTGDGFAIQQINYVKDGTSCLTIMKADLKDGYPVMTTIEVDNTAATQNTQYVLSVICQQYGIDFEFD